MRCEFHSEDSGRLVCTLGDPDGEHIVSAAVEAEARLELAAALADVESTGEGECYWSDSNSDYRRSADESVTWELRTIAGDADHFDVIRKQGAATEVVEARSLVSEIAFEYDVPAPATQVVATTLNYDAFAGTGAAQRTLYFAERLRNAGEA